jgi:hypothetical protein
MVIIFRVILDTVEKSLILNQFWYFDLVENMLNDMVVTFF